MPQIRPEAGLNIGFASRGAFRLADDPAPIRESYARCWMQGRSSDATEIEATTQVLISYQ